jgi:hypothetical protein
MSSESDDAIPPTTAALAEALALSGEILRNLELTEIPLTNIALKVGRLARLLNDFEMQRIIEYEVGGYPGGASGIPPEVWRLAVAAGRRFEEKDSKTGEAKQFCYRTSISGLENEIEIETAALSAASDGDVSISSANPNQYLSTPSGNWRERAGIRKNLKTAAERLASRQAFLYSYALRKHYELKFSGIADDIFTGIRERVDAAIGESVPEAVKRLTAVYDNLRSDNSEDWSNAAHSCRRVLEDLADVLFPATSDVRTKQVGSKTVTIKLGKDNYINRLVAFAEDNSDSGRFRELVGSHLEFLGDRLDAVFKAAQKGSHATILSREEANRYVVYTYLLVGDLLSLRGN